MNSLTLIIRPIRPSNVLLARRTQLLFKRTTSNSSSGGNNSAATISSLKHTKTTAGSGAGSAGGGFSIRGPVTWPALGLVAIVAASAVAYYKIERERRLENAMGKIVSTGKPAIGGPWSLVDLD